jgi:hypothetical protein
LLRRLLDHRNQRREEKEEHENNFAIDVLREEIKSGALTRDFRVLQERALAILNKERATEGQRRDAPNPRLESSHCHNLDEIRKPAQFGREGAHQSNLSYNSDEFEFESFTSVGPISEQEHDDDNNAANSDSDTFSLDSLLRELTEARVAEGLQRARTHISFDASSFGSFFSDDED